MTLREIRSRWWWSDPAQAMRSAFPEKSSLDTIRKYFGRCLNGPLSITSFLGKRFDLLTREEMSRVAKVGRVHAGQSSRFDLCATMILLFQV